MIILLLAVLVSWGLWLWLGTLFGTLVPGVMQLWTNDERDRD